MQNESSLYLYNTMTKKKATFGMKLLDVIILWYYFFSPSIILRPFVSVIWVVIGICGFFIFQCWHIEFGRYIQMIIGSIAILLITSLFSINSEASLKYTMSLFLYVIIAYVICSNYDNIIIKFGRYIPNQQSHFDIVLGVNLASDNQYAERL